jgi:hypothetical protein
MKTQRRILLVVGTFMLAFSVLVAAAEILLGGLVGSLVVAGVVVASVAIYLGLVRPWQVRWGATADEAARAMPGDGILSPGALPTTRAIRIGTSCADGSADHHVLYVQADIRQSGRAVQIGRISHVARRPSCHRG